MAAPSNEVQDVENIQIEASKVQKKNKTKEVVFMTSVAGISILFGFGMTVAMAKKKDPVMFSKGIIPSHEVPETGGQLGMRALAWGTFYSVSGVSLLCFAVWKMLGVRNLQEFRQKMGSMLPTIPKKEVQGKSDFKTVRELVNYIIDEDEKEKQRKREEKEKQRKKES